MKKYYDDNKIFGVLTVAASLVIFVLSVLAIHDTNTATGAGYLLFLTTGTFSRMLWDVVVDACVAFLVLLFVIVPARAFRSAFSEMSLFFLSCSALTVYVRPDRLITSFMRAEGMTRDDAVMTLMSYLPLWILSALWIYGLYHLPGTEEKSSDRALIFSGVSIIFMFASIIFTPFFEVCIFLSGYFLLIPGLKQITGKKANGLIPAAAVFFVCSLWRLYMVMAQYHI